MLTGAEVTTGAGGTGAVVDVDGADTGVTVTVGWVKVSTAIPPTTPRAAIARSAANPLTTQPDLDDAVGSGAMAWATVACVRMAVGAVGDTWWAVMCGLQ